MAVSVVIYKRPGVPKPEQLNVLLITLDTTRADALGCYGNRTAQTPYLDALAAGGARFDRCIACASLTLPSHCSIMTSVYPFVHGVRRNGVAKLADEHETLAERLSEHGMQTRAIVASYVLNSMFGVGQGFDQYSEVARGSSLIALHAERDGADVADDAIAMLDELAPHRFFLWVHFYDPHYPYESSSGHETHSRAAYAEEITYTDAQVGRLFEKLGQLGIKNRTLIVVVGDHGEAFGEHEENQHGYFVHDTTLRVPLIMHCPGVIAEGVVVKDVVRTIDAAPTILEIVGGAALERAMGESLVPLMQPQAGDLELAAYAESLEAFAQFGMSPLRSLHHDQWKYVLAPRAELYDLSTDPAENQNVIDQHPDIAERLREKMRQVIIESPAPPPRSASSIELADEDVARLAALGYVGMDAATDPDVAEIDRFEPVGDNPNDFCDVFNLYSQSHMALTAGQFEIGEKLLQKLVDRMPDAPRPRADLAFMLQQQGKMAQAYDHYRSAIEMAPDDGHIQRMFGGLLIRMRRWPEAARHLAIAVSDRPDDLEAWYNLGLAVAMQGRFDEAVTHFERALRIDPKHVSTLHALGAAYLQLGRLNEAKKRFEQALAIDPNHARARHDLGVVTKRLKAAKD